MAKTKNRKQKSTERTKGLKSSAPKSKSPFEVHINNEKLKVLGRKDKHNKGFRGVSRAKAIDKRKKTLLQEYKLQNKSNVFKDRRIGEHNNLLSNEEKLLARFAAVRAKAHKRKSIFNLGEDEILTHKGQTLSEIEKFDDPRSEDEDFEDENETGKLDKKFVEEAHFGGGLLKKTGIEGAKSHKDLIEQLISESKKRKAEKQKIKESTLQLTEDLNTEWKDLLPLVDQKQKKKDIETPQASKVDEYNKIRREMTFDSRSKVSERLKSEEELAEIEKEKLEKLENERLERMKGVKEEKTIQYTHRSADDLDDDFVYESDNEVTLAYDQEGHSNIPLEKTTEEKEEELEAEDQVSEHENEESDVETESEDDLSDLKAESSDSEHEELNKTEEKEKKETSLEEIKEDLLERKVEMDKAREELPYTFKLPKSYEELQKLLINQPSEKQSVIIERMIKCNHSSLAKENKDNLCLLFAYILQHINDQASEVDDEDTIKNFFKNFNAIVPHLFDLAQTNQENCHKSMLEVIKEKFQEYWKRPKEYPTLEVLVFLKLISVLFPTSDFRHQVVTPSLIFMEQMLLNCRVKKKRHIAYGLFLSTLVLEFTTLSKRFMPGCINFLAGLVHMAVPKSTIRLIKVSPPFNTLGSDLVLLNNQANYEESPKMEIADLIEGSITESFKIRTIFTAMKILNEFFDDMKNLPSNVEIFKSVFDYCSLIPSDMYPKSVREQIDIFLKEYEITVEKRQLKYVVMEAKKPKALRLYEPKIQEVYDGKRYKVQSKEKAERDKLLHKLKREKKGALREIRRDNSFLSRVKITQQVQSDRERRDKVKRILAEASVQQSELNAFDRQKKKK